MMRKYKPAIILSLLFLLDLYCTHYKMKMGYYWTHYSATYLPTSHAVLLLFNEYHILEL